MVIVLGNILIETDFIEKVEQKSDHTCEIQFSSGCSLEVVCGVSTTKLGAGEFDGTASQFLLYIANSKSPGFINSDSEFIDVKGLSSSEILGRIATIRLNTHKTLKEAAESLSIDTRTFKAYLRIGES